MTQGIPGRSTIPECSEYALITHFDLEHETSHPYGAANFPVPWTAWLHPAGMPPARLAPGMDRTLQGMPGLDTSQAFLRSKYPPAKPEDIYSLA